MDFVYLLTSRVCSLNGAVEKAFTALGSSFITKLDFRDLWAFVSQKGIVGTSPIEQVSTNSHDFLLTSLC